jgi:hypothetical protein
VIVGYGTATIVAVAMALGRVSIAEIPQIIAAMQTTRINREDPEPGCLGCLGNRPEPTTRRRGTLDGRRAQATAHSGGSPRDQLAYNTQNHELLQFIGRYRPEDFITRCWIPDIERGGDLAEITLRAATERRRGSGEREQPGLTATMWTAVLEAASTGATAGGDVAERAVGAAMFATAQQAETQPSRVRPGVVAADLGDELAGAGETTRDTIIVRVGAGACGGSIPLISTGSRVEQVADGGEVITCNVWITIPDGLSMSGHNSVEEWRRVYSLIDETVRGDCDSNNSARIRAIIGLLATEITRAHRQVHDTDSASLQEAADLL